MNIFAEMMKYSSPREETESTELSDKDIIDLFYLYFDEVQPTDIKPFGIGDIQVESIDDIVTISVSLKRAGLLIGKRGSRIRRVRDYIGNMIEKTVHIKTVDI